MKVFQREKLLRLGIGITITEDAYGRIHCRETDIILLDEDRRGHFWCWGTTRVGKTRLLENMIEQDIRKGYSVILMDPKNDQELFSKIVQVTLETGRKDDLMLLSPIFPEHSITINPLEYHAMPEELVAHIVSGVETGSEPFFYNVAYETSLIIVQTALLLKKYNKTEHEKLTLQDIKNVVSHKDMANLLTQISSIDTDIATQLSADLKKITDTQGDYYAKISSSLRVALMELTQGNVGKVLGCVRGNRVIERLQSDKQIIFVIQTGSLLTDKAARTTSKVLISMFKSYVGRVFSSNLKYIDPPIMFYADEAQNTLYSGIEDLFAKAGGAGFWMHGFSQSDNQIIAQFSKKEQGRSILDNINTRVYMRAPDPETASYVSSSFGFRKRMSPILTMGGHANLKESTEEILKPQQIMRLSTREFIMTTYKGKYRGLTNQVSELLLNIEYPSLSVEQKEEYPSLSSEPQEKVINHVIEKKQNSQSTPMNDIKLTYIDYLSIFLALAISSYAVTPLEYVLSVKYYEIILGIVTPFITQVVIGKIGLKVNNSSIGYWLLAPLSLSYYFPCFTTGWFITITIRVILQRPILIWPFPNIEFTLNSILLHYAKPGIVTSICLFGICSVFKPSGIMPYIMATIIGSLTAILYFNIKKPLYEYISNSFLYNKLPEEYKRNLKIELLLSELSPLWTNVKLNKNNINISLANIAEQTWTKDKPIIVENTDELPKFNLNEFNDFWTDNIANSFMPYQSKRAIAELIKFLEDNRQYSSIAGAELNDLKQNYSNMADITDTYSRLSQVPLWAHSLNVANEIIKISSNIPILDTRIIAALGHDIGKINSKNHKKYYYGMHAEDSVLLMNTFEEFNKLPEKVAVLMKDAKGNLRLKI